MFAIESLKLLSEITLKKNVIRTHLLVVFLFIINFSFSQEIQKNEFGLAIVDNINIYNELILSDSSKKLIDLEKLVPTIKKDVRYSTTNNFAGKKFYKKGKIFLRLPAAFAIKNIQEELLRQNLSLKIYDAYRPYSVTKEIWEFVKDDRYAASPQKGSRHNRGCAVDLTIIDLSTGVELEMPTPYDDFSVKAHQDFMNLPVNILNNRELLKSLMIKNGFEPLSSEWWHFDFKGWNKFELIDISFEEIENQDKK